MNAPRILVVEDDQSNRELMYHFLTDYSVVFADTVKDALKQIKQSNINCVLLDISLRDNEDGLKISRYIKDTKGLRDIPVIATTAHAFTYHKKLCLESGCDEYLAKPIQRTRLLELVQAHVHKN